MTKTLLSRRIFRLHTIAETLEKRRLEKSRAARVASGQEGAPASQNPSEPTQAGVDQWPAEHRGGEGGKANCEALELWASSSLTLLAGPQTRLLRLQRV